MSKTILVTGSLAFDQIMDFKGKFAQHIDPTKLHILNISFNVENLKKQRGGTAGNIAYNLALLNNNPLILGAAGQDFTEYKSFLEASGVNTENIKIAADDFTAQATIMTDLDHNQITSYYPGAQKYSADLKIETINPKPDFVVIAPTDPQAMVNFANECQSLKINYLFDPGMLLPMLNDDDLKKSIDRATILIGNDYEMGIILKRLNTSAEDLLKTVEVVITTLGGEGSIIKTKTEEVKISPAKPREVLDPTGAGDAYRAGFLSGYLNGLDLKTAGQMGSVTACYAVENYGTTTHKFSPEEFKKRYQENFEEKLIS